MDAKSFIRQMMNKGKEDAKQASIRQVRDIKRRFRNETTSMLEWEIENQPRLAAREQKALDDNKVQEKSIENYKYSIMQRLLEAKLAQDELNNRQQNQPLDIVFVEKPYMKWYDRTTKRIYAEIYMSNGGYAFIGADLHLSLKDRDMVQQVSKWYEPTSQKELDKKVAQFRKQAEKWVAAL